MQRSVLIIGWSTIILCILIILLELINIFQNSSIGQVEGFLRSLPQTSAALNSMNNILLYNRIWSVYSIAYFLAILAGALQFVRYREIGRKILEIACWIGLFNACIDSLLSYVLWKNLQAAFTYNLRTMGVGNLFLLGTVAIIFGFFLWIIPSIGMLAYLRSSKLKALMKQSAV